MEMQFYPPGFAPFADGIGCDNLHWCAALNIDSLECTEDYGVCNHNCEEPVNFAFIQTNGVPAGPPGPQNSTLATYTPNVSTLLMNPGDKITVHMFDAAIPGGHAFEVFIDDLTTKKTGFMIASAANGFEHTPITDCSGQYFNFEPEYSSAKPANLTPWTAVQANISTEYEIGHFTACTSVTGPGTTNVGGVIDTYYHNCVGPYDTATDGDAGNPEINDAPCFPLGDTHGTFASAPDEVAGCKDSWWQNGDLDYDGSP